MKSPKDMIFLIVDDMDNMRRSIRAMLKLIGYGRDYLEAGNGLEAYEILTRDETPIDFIIADINMPKMTGTQLLNRIRQNKDLRDLPFLMITAEANQEVVAEAAEHEVDAYLTKPFVTASLEQKINELLESFRNPSPQVLHLRQARDLEEQGQIDEAIAELKKAVLLQAQSSRPFRELGRLHLKKREVEAAIKFFKKAIEINRLDVTSFHYLGQLYYQMGDIERAIQFFSRAVDISPRQTERAMHFAKLLLEQKQLGPAEKVFRVVLRSKSEDADIKEDIADACSSHGLHELAAKLYKDLLRGAPDRGYLRKKLGMSLNAMGEHMAALPVLEKAAEQLGDDIELLLEIARIYLAINLPVRADKWASRALRLDMHNQEARKILEKCM